MFQAQHKCAAVGSQPPLGLDYEPGERHLPASVLLSVALLSSNRLRLTETTLTSVSKRNFTTPLVAITKIFWPYWNNKNESHRSKALGVIMKAAHIVASVALVSTAQPVYAKKRVEIQAEQIGSESVRFYKGTPTVDLTLGRGAVQVTPHNIQDKRVAFVVTVYNDGTQPINFGIADVSASINSSSIAILSKDDLIRKAENKALWSQIGMALLGGVAAGLAASQTNTYSARTYTPYGTYSSYYSVPSLAGALQAQSITNSTAYGISAIQYKLDLARETLTNDVLQLTTVDPGKGFSGVVVLDKPKKTQLPLNIKLNVSLNGQTYPFAFRVVEQGTPLPVWTQITPLEPAAGEEVLEPMEVGAAAPAELRPLRPVPPFDSARDRAPRQFPANTESGFCLHVAQNYQGTGSSNRPYLKTTMPRCSAIGVTPTE